MNHIYRNIWNARTRTWTAVAETAIARGKSSGSGRRAATVVGTVLSAAALGGGLASAAWAQPAPSVAVSPGSGNTNAYVVPNGVTVVNIATPNAAGLSHNRFTSYNVAPVGLVLNNGNNDIVARQSQLAGQVTANMNLTMQAGVVLNEVVSNNRSTLAGFTEVLGGRADVVLANPYGITCTGCGFINTDRVVLSTGNPFLAANGGLGGFSVGQGDILVTGNGLNASAQQVLDLVTRSVRVEAPINGNDVSVTTGTNRWDFATRAVTGAAAPTGAAPTYAIDTSALGGMYANRIRLLATEAGVGVRMAGDAAASAGDFTLSAAGRIELQNAVSAARDVAVATTDAGADALALTGARLTSTGQTRLAATGRAVLAGGALVTGTDLSVNAGSLLDSAGGTGAAGDDVRHAGGTLDVATTGAAVLGATRWTADGNWSGRFGNLATTAATRLSSRDGTLIASAGQGDLALGLAVLQSAGDLRLSSSGRITLAAGGTAQSRGGALALTATNGLDNAGTLTADAGSATVRVGGSLAQRGMLHAALDIDIADATGGGTQAIGNVGSILANGALRLRGAAVDNGTAGVLKAASLDLAAGQGLSNAGLVDATAGGAMLRVDGTLANAGRLHATGAIDIADRQGGATQAVTHTGTLIAEQALALKAGAIATGTGSWTQAAGSTVAAGSLDNAGTWLLSTGAGTDRVDVAGTVANGGTLQGAGNVLLNAGALDNRGTLLAAVRLDIATRGDVANAAGATAQAGTALAIASGGAVHNAANGVARAQSVVLTAAGGLDNAGTLSADGGAAVLRVDGTVANSGAIYARQTLDLADRQGGAGVALANTGVLLADADLALRTAALSNRPAGADRATGRIQAAMSIAIDATDLDNAGTVQAGTGLSARTRGALTNAGTLQAAGALDLDAAGALANTASGVLKADAVRLSAGGGLTNAGLVSADGGDAVLRVDGALANSGELSAARTLDLDDRAGGASQSVANSGRLLAGQDLALRAAGIANAAGGFVQAATGSRVAAAALDNAGTWLLSTRAGANGGVGDTVAVAGRLANAGTLQSEGAAALAAGSVANAGVVFTGGALAATAAGAFDNAGGGVIQSATVATLQAGGHFGNAAGALVKAGTVALTASGLDNTGVLTADQGSATLRVDGTLANGGTVYAHQGLDIAGRQGVRGGDVANTGVLLSDGGIALQAAALSNVQAGTDTATGRIQAASGTRVSAASLDNRGTWLLSTTAGAANTLAVDGRLINTGKLQGSGTIALDAGALDNAGVIYATDALRASAVNEAVNRAGGIVQTGGRLDLASGRTWENRAGALVKAGTIGLAAGGLDNAGTLAAATGAATLRADGHIDNRGTLYAAGNLDVADRRGGATEDFANTGLVLSGAALTLKAAAASNTPQGGDPATGRIQAAGGSDVAVTSLDNAGVWLLSTRAGAADSVRVADRLTQRGTLQGAGDLALTAGALDNAGVVHAAGDLAATSRAGIDNQAGAVVQAGGQLRLTAAGAVANAASAVLRGADVALTSTGLDNGGSLVADTGAAVLRVDGTLANRGTLYAAQRLDSADRQGSGGATLVNTGRMLSDGDMRLRAGTLTNARVNGDTASGRIQAVTGSTVSADRLDNGGTWLLSRDATARDAVTVGGALANTGTLQGAGDVALAATSIDNAGVLLAGGDLGATVTALTNGAGATARAGRALRVDAATLTNRASGSRAGGDLAQGRLLGDRLELNATTLTNDGIVQGGASNASRVTASGALTNGAAGVMTLATAATGAGRVAATRIVNDGALQSVGGLELAVGAGGLASAGTVYAGGDLGVKGRDTGVAYTADVGGVMESGGLLDLSGAGATTLNVRSTGSVVGNRVAIAVGTVNLADGGTVSSAGDLTLAATRLTLAGANSAVLGSSSGGGTTRVTTTTALINNGLLFSSNDLVVGATSIVNGITGGIAALGNATAQATAGDFLNQGALYARGTLKATSTGTLTNAATASRYQGTIDADGAVVLQAATLINNSTIHSLGTIDVDAATLRNQFLGGDNRAWGADTTAAQVETGHQGKGYNGCGCVDQSERWYYRSTWSRTQYYNGAVPSAAVKPQIIGATRVGLVFQTAQNLGGLISGRDVVLTGKSGSATLVNDDLALSRIDYTRTWTEHTKYAAAGPAKYYTRRVEDDNTTNLTSVVSSLGAGIYAGTLTGSGFALTNNGATSQPVSAARAGGAVAASTGATGGRAASAGGLAGTVNGPAATAATSFGGAGGATTQAATGAAATGDAGVVAATGFGGASGATARAATTASTVPGAASLVSATVTGVRTASGQNAVSFVAGNAASGVSGTTFNGVSIPLPANPNGLYVVASAPAAQYLVETNPRYRVGSASLGSDYLAKQLGYDADTLVRRLGDASYEAYLIRQQLVAQTGNAVLAGYRDAAFQVQRLMDQAAAESKSLGLTYGQALTPAQQANLKQDMVWMVQTEVNGQVVLAPVVYLSAQTRAGITGGAVITAENASLSLTSMTNTGGTIAGTRSLDIVSTGDITNTSGTISGGDVSLTSTQGSIVNRTVSSGSGGDQRYVTDIGKTAAIVSTGTLAMDAAKDINNLGARVNAGGDASLKSGGAITFDTIENKTTDTTRGAYRQGLLGSGTTVSTTTRLEQVKSGLTTGGNLAMKSGSDITLAGTDTKVGGNADLGAGGNLNIVARENSTTTRTTSQAAGLGMNGAVFGTSKTTTDSQSVRNVGSSFEVGGNASLAAQGDLTIQGSTVDVAGNGKIQATNVNVLAGRNYDETTSTTVNTSVLRPIAGSTSSQSGASAGASSGARGGTASAGAGAQASAGSTSSGGLQLSAVDVTQSKTTDLKNVASTINFGGDVKVDAKKDVNLVGSTLNAGGDAMVNARDINVTAAKDIATSSTTTTSVAIGLMGSSDNKAGASADAGARATNGEGRTTPSAQAQAGARASASSDNKLNLMQASKTTTDTLDVTHQGAAITSKGSTTLNASNAVTVTGSQIAAGSDVTVNAKDMTFAAANDVHETRTTSNTTSAGLYGNAKADASAEAGAKASTGPLGTKAEAGAKAEASAGVEVGLYVNNTQSSTVEGSTQAKVSGISAGGSINRNATNGITDVGTAIEAGGDLNQSARTITSKAAADTTYGSSSTDSHTGKIGAYAEASASASAGASTSGKAEAKSEAGAGAGVRASYEFEQEKLQSASSQAVVSNVKVGGNVNSTSSGATSLEGTNISAGKDVNLTAGSLDYSAAKNTASSSTGTTSAGASAGVDLVNKSVTVGGSYEGAKASESSSTAVVGTTTAGGNLNLKTTGDTRLEGTSLGAGGAATVATGGNLKVEAARNTTESKSQDISASAEATVGKGGGKSSKGFEAEGSYAQSTGSSSNAVAGSITSGGPLTVSSSGNATFIGTTLSSGGDTSVSAGGNVSFDAARSTSKTQEFGVAASVGASSEKETKGGRTTSTSEKSMGVSGNYGQSSSDTAQAASVQSGGNVSITSGGNTRFEGTGVQAAGAVAVDAGGKVQMDAARSSSSALSVGGSFEGSSSREREGPAAGEASATTPRPTPAAPAAAAAAGGAKPAAPVDKGVLTSDATLSYESQRSSQATTLQGGSGVTISSGTAAPGTRP